MAVLHCRGEGDQAWHKAPQLGKLELRQAYLLLSAFLPPWGFCTTCSHLPPPLQRRTHLLLTVLILALAVTSVCICRTLDIYLATLLCGCFLHVNTLIFIGHIAYMLYPTMPSVLQSTRMLFLLTFSVCSYLGSLQTNISYILINIVCLPTPHGPSLAASRVCCSGCCLLSSSLQPPSPCGVRGATSTRQVGRQWTHTKEGPHLTPACTRHSQGREKETHKKIL